VSRPAARAAGSGPYRWSRDSSSGGNKYDSEIQCRPGLLRVSSEQTVSVLRRRC
jgi:hypothetical protein